MNANQYAAPPPPAREDTSLVGSVLKLLIGFLLTTSGSLLFSILLEWVGMHSWWQDQWVEHSRLMVAEDLGYLAEYRRSLVVADGEIFAATLAEYATRPFYWSGIGPGIQHLLQRLQADPDTVNKPMLRELVPLLRAAPDYLMAAVYVTQDAAIRLAVIVLALPAFLFAAALGLVDGLARRDIRRWSGGRESSFVYHHAKRWLWPALTGGFVLYMTWPTGGFNPAWMVLPFAAMAAWAVGVMAATFKKYL